MTKYKIYKVTLRFPYYIPATSKAKAAEIAFTDFCEDTPEPRYNAEVIRIADPKKERYWMKKLNVNREVK